MSFAGRLYRGDVTFDFVGRRKRWYVISGVLLLICLVSFIFRGFNWGIEFRGGTIYQFPATANVQLDDAQSVVQSAGPAVDSRQFLESSLTGKQILVKTGPSDAQ